MSRAEIREIKDEVLNKLDDVLNSAGVNALIGRKKEEEKKKNIILWIFAIIGTIVAVAAIAYVVYRYLKPDYLDDFDDDFDDDFNDDFFDDDDEDDGDEGEADESIEEE